MTTATARWLTPLVQELRQLLLGEVVPALAVAMVGTVPVARDDVAPLTHAQLQGTDWLTVSEAAGRIHVNKTAFGFGEVRVRRVSDRLC